jgi:simple sugar transport system permease protein
MRVAQDIRTAAQDEASQASRAPTYTLRQLSRAHALTLATLGVALLMWLAFVISSPNVFLSSRIYAAFGSTTPLFAMIALALTLVVIAREIDLSFGSVMALSMVGFVKVWQATGNVPAAVLVCLVTGVACGLLNGFLVAVLSIPSLVLTLGTMFFFRGLEMVLIGGHGTVLSVARDPELSLLRTVLNGRTLGVPHELLWTVAVAVVLWVVLNRTRFGSHVFLVGDSPVSAQLMGIRVARVKITTFAIVGLIAAFTGMMAAMQLRNFFPNLGDGALLPTIASVFVGGTSVFGGTGSIVGTFVGAFTIGAINAGVVSAGVGGFYTQLYFGLVIMISLVLQTLISGRMRPVFEAVGGGARRVARAITGRNRR